jgi:hypothetical protein
MNAFCYEPLYPVKSPGVRRLANNLFTLYSRAQIEYIQLRHITDESGTDERNSTLAWSSVYLIT